MVELSEWEHKWIIKILGVKNSTSQLKEIIDKIYEDGFEDGKNEAIEIEPEAPDNSWRD